jgi:hypothetical protein
MNFIFNLNAFSWKAMKPTAGRSEVRSQFMKTRLSQATLALASGG